ncbi:MAG TPA: thioredoxin family protein, partial [Spirochaeta sp.]|nr:thioredoxin family protein [Spirochaeta sp.]
HCPYVLHIIEYFSIMAGEYQKQGIGIVGINSNDVDTYPDDSPANMAEFSKKYDLSFPYLFDETQKAARSYRASCTPDFFLFNSERKLVYRGQLDDSRPGNNKPVTGRELRAALDALLIEEPVVVNQKPSMGCNIKWKSGNEPDYF